MSRTENRPPGGRPKRPKEPLDPFQHRIRDIGRAIAGKPLSEALTEDSPLKELIAEIVQAAFDEEMREHLGYEPHERQKASEDAPEETRRRNTRNGHSRKRLKTSHGETEIEVPRDRQGSFEPHIVPKYGSITREVEDRVISMYAMGMTTRDIRDHVRELYGLKASEMFVSRIVERLEPILAEWRGRPLEAIYPIVFIDALHTKQRHAIGVASTAVYVVNGYGEAGGMDVLGLYMAQEGETTGESASFWHQVLIELEKRGVKDIMIVCADQLSGLEEAVASVFPQARFQPCIVHAMRSSLRRVPWSERKIVAREIKEIYQAPTYDRAEAALEHVRELYGRRYPAVVRQWAALLPRLSDLWNYSTPLRKLVYTINPMENVNRQIRKVTKNRGVFPNRESALRLLTLVLMRIDQKNKKRVRPVWTRIVQELAIHFPDRLPENWGLRI